MNRPAPHTWPTVTLVRECRFYKKAAAFVLRAVAKHSPDLAQAVVDSGALDALVPCLEVRYATVAWALLCSTRHSWFKERVPCRL